MTWFVFGDLLFLADIVNGVAAITAAVGTTSMNDYTGMLKIAAVIGFVAMLLQGLSAGGVMPVSRFLMVPIFFAMMAVPKVTVTMENVYSGATRTIAGVPFGIALTGQIFSFMGLRLTEMVETAYSYPGVTDDGFNRALDDWRTLRRVAGDPSMYAAANGAGGGDFARSWVNYISTCTAFGLDVGNLDFTAVQTGPLAHVAVYNPSRSFGAEIFTGGGAATSLDCADAHAALLAYSRQRFLPALKNSVLAYHFYDPVRDGTIAGPSTPSWALVEPKLASMFGVLGGLGAVSIDEALLSIFVGSLYDHGAMRRMQLDRKDAYAVMVGDSIRARNAQWMAQGDIFQQYVKPLLSFIEGFWFALFPVVAIALLLGARGLAVMLRYLQIGLWIQLWGPCMAVVNLFVYHAVVGDLANLDQAALTLSSFGGQFAADSVVQQYLGVAGLFASSVPALALLLVTGSMYTLNTVATSVGGPDTISEANAAPARQALSPKIQVMPDYEDGPMHGLMRTGAPAQMPKLNLSEIADHRLSSAESELAGSRVSYARSIDRALTHVTGSNSESFSGSLWRDGSSAQSSDVYAHTRGDSFRSTFNDMRSHGLTETEAASFTARIGASVAAGRGVPSVGSLTGDGAVGAAWRSERGISDQKLKQWSDEIGRAYSEDSTLSASLVTSFSADNERGFRQSGYSNTSFTSSRAIREEGQDYAATERRFEEAASFSASVGVSASPDISMLARRIVDDPSRFDSFKRMLANHSLIPDATQRAQELHAWGWSSDTLDSRRMAYAAGGLLALAQQGKYDELHAAISADGYYVPMVGDQDAQRGVGRSLGDGPAVSLEGRGVGGFDPAVAPGWTPAAVHAGDRAQVRAEIDRELGPVVREAVAADRLQAERSAAEAAARPAASEGPGRWITGLADAAADAGFGRVRREFLDGFEREGLNAGLSLQEARYYAFLRATPELDTVEKLATADGLRNGVLNQYHAVPDAGAAQAAQIEEAARAVDVRNDQLLGQIAARRERINPTGNGDDLNAWQRNAR